MHTLKLNTGHGGFRGSVGHCPQKKIQQNYRKLQTIALCNGRYQLKWTECFSQSWVSSNTLALRFNGGFGVSRSSRAAGRQRFLNQVLSTEGETEGPSPSPGNTSWLHSQQLLTLSKCWHLSLPLIAHLHKFSDSQVCVCSVVPNSLQPAGL